MPNPHDIDPESLPRHPVGNEPFHKDSSENANSDAKQDGKDKESRFNYKDIAVEIIALAVGSGFFALFGDFLDFIGIHGSKPWCILGGLISIEFALAHLLVKNLKKYARQVKYIFVITVASELVAIVCVEVSAIRKPNPAHTAHAKTVSISTNALLKFEARLMPSDEYPTGTTVGNLEFNKGDFDIRLDIEAQNQMIHNLDIKISFNKRPGPEVILGINQLSEIPGVTCFPNSSENLAVKIRDDATGSNYTVILDGNTKNKYFTKVEPFSSVWCIHCNEIFQHSTARFVIKARWLGRPSTPPYADWEPQILVAIGSCETESPEGMHKLPIQFVYNFIKNQKEQDSN